MKKEKVLVVACCLSEKKIPSKFKSLQQLFRLKAHG